MNRNVKRLQFLVSEEVNGSMSIPHELDIENNQASYILYHSNSKYPKIQFIAKGKTNLNNQFIVKKDLEFTGI